VLSRKDIVTAFALGWSLVSTILAGMFVVNGPSAEGTSSPALVEQAKQELVARSEIMEEQLAAIQDNAVVINFTVRPAGAENASAEKATEFTGTQLNVLMQKVEGEYKVVAVQQFS
jgi:hypothetical protein